MRNWYVFLPLTLPFAVIKSCQTGAANLNLPNPIVTNPTLTAKILESINFNGSRIGIAVVAIILAIFLGIVAIVAVRRIRVIK